MFRLELASPHPLHQALRKIEAFSLLTRALLSDFHGHSLPRGCSCTPTSGASTPACCSRVRDRLCAERAVSCRAQPGRTISNARAAHTGENCSQQEPAPATSAPQQPRARSRDDAALSTRVRTTKRLSTSATNAVSSGPCTTAGGCPAFVCNRRSRGGESTSIAHDAYNGRTAARCRSCES